MLCGSWQQRVLNSPEYATADGPLICTLTRCFRMVPELVDLASRLFYNNRLVAVPQPPEANIEFDGKLKRLKQSLEGPEPNGSLDGNLLATTAPGLTEQQAGNELPVQEQHADIQLSAQEQSLEEANGLDCNSLATTAPGFTEQQAGNELPVQQNLLATAPGVSQQQAGSELSVKQQHADIQQLNADERECDSALLFIGVLGREGMPEDLLSHANIMEVEEVVRVVKLLVTSGVSTSSISVISPFRKQIAVIRVGLRAVGLGSVRVGAVVDFQGQESDIVVVSTVVCRASPSGESSGVFRDPNQFNVTITRPKSLLVVVGNPFVLAQDNHWKALLQHAKGNNAYTGVPFSVGSEPVDLMPDQPRFQDDEDIVWRLLV
jgi:hypothetical protein